MTASARNRLHRLNADNSKRWFDGLTMSGIARVYSREIRLY